MQFRLDEVGKAILANLIINIKEKNIELNYINLSNQIKVKSYQEIQIKEYVNELETIYKICIV